MHHQRLGQWPTRSSPTFLKVAAVRGLGISTSCSGLLGTIPFLFIVHPGDTPVGSSEWPTSPSPHALLIFVISSRQESDDAIAANQGRFRRDSIEHPPVDHWLIVDHCATRPRSVATLIRAIVILSPPHASRGEPVMTLRILSTVYY